MRALPSAPALATRLPSGLKATAATAPLCWPSGERRGFSAIPEARAAVGAPRQHELSVGAVRGAGDGVRVACEHVGPGAERLRPDPCGAVVARRDDLLPVGARRHGVDALLVLAEQDGDRGAGGRVVDAHLRVAARREDATVARERDVGDDERVPGQQVLLLPRARVPEVRVASACGAEQRAVGVEREVDDLALLLDGGDLRAGVEPVDAHERVADVDRGERAVGADDSTCLTAAPTVIVRRRAPPSVAHTPTVPSPLPVTIDRPSGVKDAAVTAVWWWRVSRKAPSGTLHTWAAPSVEAATSVRPSGEKSRSVTAAPAERASTSRRVATS